MRFLKTNTATIITVGPFYDKTDGVTIETALTITNERITFIVDNNDGSAPTLVLDNVTGATSGTSNDLNYITNNDAGLMQMELSAANVNYLGRAMLSITDAANHCPVFHEFMILPANIFDSLVAGTDVLDASMTQILGTAVSAPATAGILDVNLKNIANAAVSTSTAQLGVNAVQAGATAWGSGAVTAASIATGAITNAKFAAGAIDAAAVADGAIDAATFAAGAITAAAVATGAIDADAIADNAIDAGAIATGAITAAKFAAGAIDAAAVADGAIDAATFAAGAITAAAVATGAIDADAIADNAIDAGAIATGAITAAKFAAGAIDAAAIAADAIDADAVKADAVTKIQTGLATPTNITAGTITTVTNLTNAASNGDLTATMKSSVNSEVDTALTDINLDHLIKVAKDTNWATTVTKESVIDLMTSKSSSQTFDRAEDALEAVRDSIAVVSAGVAATIQATANIETTGSLIGGTYASTYLSNGTYYITAPVTPAVGGYGLNAYLTFGAGSGQYINSVTIRGFYQNSTGSARFCQVGAYNYVTNSIDVLSDSTSRMNHATANATYTYALLSAHQKADGEVRIYFLSPSVTTGDRLNIDQCLVNVNTAGASASDIAEAVKQKMIITFYEGGVWIDTNAGTDGTILGTNGTPANPVKTYADALVLAANLGVKRFYLRPDSTIELTQSHANWRFIGKGLINLSGEAIDDAVFEDCEEISGIGTGDDATFINCQIRTCTLGAAYFSDCGFDGTLTLVASKNYTMHHCYDANPSTATQPIITFAGSNNVGLRQWTGGVELASMAATDYLTADGAGRIVIGSTCSANPNGTITIRGPWSACTDNVAGGFKGTITETSRFDTAQINAQVVDVLRTDTLPDSVATDGSQPTIAQALYEILQFLTEKSVSSTTLTVKKPDGSTALMTFTLDSATSPTSITRAS
jgi:hypothetical protein